MQAKQILSKTVYVVLEGEDSYEAYEAERFNSIIKVVGRITQRFIPPYALLVNGWYEIDPSWEILDTLNRTASVVDELNKKFEVKRLQKEVDALKDELALRKISSITAGSKVMFIDNGLNAFMHDPNEMRVKFGAIYTVEEVCSGYGHLKLVGVPGTWMNTRFVQVV